MITQKGQAGNRLSAFKNVTNNRKTRIRNDFRIYCPLHYRCYTHFSVHQFLLYLLNSTTLFMITISMLLEVLYIIVWLVI